jgi:curved DNA-binding protein CbpA
MDNPYSVLGVSQSATDEEIKQAYRKLAKKYHPDNYTGSPLSDLASEKMSQINAAYDKIQEERKQGYSASYQQTYSYTGYSENGKFSDIRNFINMGRILDAEQLLDGIPASSRDAEWNFLKGNVLYAKGFLEEASTYFERAVNIDPQNYEYRMILDRINMQRQFGYGPSGGYSFSTCTPCDMCSTLLCANCLCGSCRCCCTG